MIMKKIKFLLLFGLMTFGLSSCYDLSLEPKGILDDAALLGNETGAKTYLAGIYMNMPIEDFNYSVTEGFRKGNFWDAAKSYEMSIDGEAVGWPWGIDGAGGFGYWPYDQIRQINAMLQKLPAYKANYTESTYNSLMGEAHFLRAFYYFAMAKRYGGVPIIDQVQNPTAPADSLNVPRATELATYKFIQSDLQFAIDNMASRTDVGRANKFVAAALMSRAMLYAGTIAKYGGYTTSSPDRAAQAGYVGIPAGEAQNFFTAAYNAAKFFDTANSGYELVGENAADKEQNFADLFVNQTNEDIFIKQYNVTAPYNTYLFHSYDGCVSPSGDFANWPGSQLYPSLESVEMYQTLPVENADGTPRRYDTRDQLWKGLEPRLLATVYFSGMTLRGATFDIRRGFYRTYTGTMADAQLGVGSAPINDPSNRVVATGRWNTDATLGGGRVSGNHGIWNNDIENNTGTGFFIRKYVNYKSSKDQAAGYGCSQSWKVFRYAEILLNRAEAAYELGMKQEAYDLINRIRNRAGATVWTPKSAPAAVYVVNNQTVDENLQFIRDERGRELMFENHRWWDLRRWRVADKVLSQLRSKALMPYLVVNENKYIFIREYNVYGKQYNFDVRYYYEPIPAGELSKNPELVQNPIY
jgi:hypothetical protein